MNTLPPYRVMLTLTDVSALDAWVSLGCALALESSEPSQIYLSGLIPMPEGVSLSEGTLQARQMRDVLDSKSREQPVVHDETRVYVDYQPFLRVLDDLREKPMDLLLVQWNGPTEAVGGISTDELLQSAPCDVVLISRDAWQQDGPVLLSLRGGPNLSLSMRVAEALAGQSTITLFHAAAATGNLGRSPLTLAMEANLHIGRVVTAAGNAADLIATEATGHKAIIMGAGLFQPAKPHGAVGSMARTVYEKTQKPLVLVRAFQPEELAFHRPRSLHRRELLSARVDRWFAENTFHSSEYSDLGALLALKEKQGLTISLGLPALNEEATVGHVIQTVKRALMDDVPLLDEIVLIDSNSEDRTVEIARECGIPVYKHPEILAEMGTNRGKGEALWKSLHVLKGDIIAWLDTDITNIHPRFVYGLLGPLLKRLDIHYVKGFYERPMKVGAQGQGQVESQGGGRVTELVARPLLNLFYPELSGMIQPLSGVFAGRRAILQSVPFFSGYGVETGLLIDLHDQVGLNGIAQTDLEELVHHSQSLVSLSKMSFAILQVFIARLEGRYGVQLLEKANRSMKLLVQEPERFALDIVEIGDVERPPILSVPGYSRVRTQSV